MFKVASLVAILTLLSKVLGLARDLVIAKFFGTSINSDAFNMAYLFTGNFFIIFGCIGGPFYSAVVASIPKIDLKNLRELFYKILWRGLALFSVIAALIYFFKPYLLTFFIDKQLKPAYFELTLTNIDLLLPLIIITAPVGIICALLNIFKRYYMPSLSPAVVNLALISTVFILGASQGGISLAIGMSIGGVISLILLIPQLINILKNPEAQSIDENKLKTKKSAEIDGEANKQTPAAVSVEAENQVKSVKKNSNLISSPVSATGSKVLDSTKPKSELQVYHHVLYPALLNTAMAQLMVFIDSYFCKGLADGSWTSILLANRLIQMPMGILLTAFLVPLFPQISKFVKDGNTAGIKQKLYRALKILVGLCLIATIVGMSFNEMIIRLLFERGAFDARSTAMVSELFFYLCLSMIPYVLKDSFARTFYSFNDARTPFFIMIFGMAFKFTLNSFLVERFGLNGIAMSTVILNVVNASLLFLILRVKYFKARH
jgi:putative peptidoglycan lipid II flippase